MENLSFDDLPNADEERADLSFDDIPDVSFDDIQGVDTFAQGVGKVIQNTPERLTVAGGGLMQAAGDGVSVPGEASLIQIAKDEARGDAPGFFDKLKAGVSIAADLPRYALDKATPEDSPLGKFTRGLSKKGREVSEAAREDLAANQPNVEGDFGKFGVDVARAVIDMGPAIGGGIATRSRATAMAMMGTQVGGSTYDDYISKGMTPSQAAAAAKFKVFAEVIPETIPVLAILKKGSPLVKRMVSSTLGEGAQEMVTSVLEQTYDARALEDMSLKDAMAGIDWGNVAYSGAVGAATGGTLAVAAHPFSGKEKGPGQPQDEDLINFDDLESGFSGPAALPPADVAKDSFVVDPEGNARPELRSEQLSRARGEAEVEGVYRDGLNNSPPRPLALPPSETTGNFVGDSQGGVREELQSESVDRARVQADKEEQYRAFVEEQNTYSPDNEGQASRGLSQRGPLSSARNAYEQAKRPLTLTPQYEQGINFSPSQEFAPTAGPKALDARLETKKAATLRTRALKKEAERNKVSTIPDSSGMKDRLKALESEGSTEESLRQEETGRHESVLPPETIKTPDDGSAIPDSAMGRKGYIPPAVKQKDDNIEVKGKSSDRFESFLDKTAKRILMEEQGQDILYNLEESETSPKSVSDTFWGNTYPALNPKMKRKFDKYLTDLTGWEPSAVVAVDAKTGEKVLADEWTDVAKEFAEDFPASVTGLEGIERGYVSLMSWATGKQKEAPLPKEITGDPGKADNARDTTNRATKGIEKPKKDTRSDGTPTKQEKVDTSKVSDTTKPVKSESDPVSDIAPGELEVDKAKDALDKAGVAGVDRTTTIAAVRRGDLTGGDVAESYKVKAPVAVKKEPVEVKEEKENTVEKAIPKKKRKAKAPSASALTKTDFDILLNGGNKAQSFHNYKIWARGRFGRKAYSELEESGDVQKAWNSKSGNVDSVESPKAEYYTDSNGQKRKQSELAALPGKTGRGAYTVLGNAIARDFKDKGTSSLIGKSVRNSQDLAVLAQVYRNPQYETLRYFFTDEKGKIVHQSGMASRLVDAVSPFGSEGGRAVTFRLISQAKKAKAKNVYFLHNHPSGDPTPSDADKVFTSSFASDFERAKLSFGGHIVINHKRFTVIDNDGQFKEHEMPGKPDYDVTIPSVYHPMLDEKITQPEKVAVIGAEVRGDSEYMVLIGRRATQGAVSLIAEIHPNEFSDLKMAAALRKMAFNSGSSDLFIYGLPESMIDKAGKAIKSGLLLDAIVVTDTGSYSMQNRGIASPGGKYALGRNAKTIIVEQKKAPYNASEVDDPWAKNDAGDKNPEKKTDDPNKFLPPLVGGYFRASKVESVSSVKIGKEIQHKIKTGDGKEHVIGELGEDITPAGYSGSSPAASGGGSVRPPSNNRAGRNMFSRNNRSPAADAYENENRKIREQDITAWTKSKKWLKRQLAPGGLLPSNVFKQKIKRDSQFEVIEFDVAHLVGQLERAIKKEYGQKARNIDETTQRLLSEVMAGKVASDVPVETKNALMGMRQYIDSLTSDYLDMLTSQANSLIAESERMKAEHKSLSEERGRIESTEENKDVRDKLLLEIRKKVSAANSRQAEALSKAELIEAIMANVGQYVHRSYRAFDDKNWPKKVPDNVLNDARAYLLSRYEEGGVDVTEAKRRTEVVLNEILKHGTAYESMEGFIQESKLGAKDLSILKKRKKIAPEITALLGEYTDPRINFSKSATKMGRLIFNQKFLDKVLEEGMGVFLFTEDTKPADATVKMAGDSSDAYDPLNGLWTTPEVAQAFKDALGKEQMENWYRTIVKMNGLIKYGKTVLSPTTAARNWMSAYFFTVANGHFDMRHMAKSVDGLREYFTHSGDAGKLAYLRELKELGVVYDTPYAGEMMRLLEDTKMADSLVYGDGKFGIKYAMDMATKFYQYGDDFWKIVGFENEKRLWIKSGLSEQAAKEKAAERIRNGYPTYSMVGRGVQSLRRFPLAGTFVSFPAEIIRTTGNMLRYIAEDMKHESTRPMAYRRIVGMSIASSFAYALQQLSMSLLGYDDDDDEAVRRMAAPWQRNSFFIYTGRNEKGNLRYLDVSFLDPYNYWKKPIMAIARDQPWEDSAKDVAKEVLLPFFGTDIAAGAIFEIMSNKKGAGSTVYNENDPVVEQTGDILNHLRKNLQPGIAANVERTLKALKGETSPSGKKYDLTDEAAAWVGFRMSTLDPKVAVYYRSFDFKDAKSEANRKVRRAVMRQKDVSDSDLKSALDVAIKIRERSYRDMQLLVKAAKRSGMSNEDINSTLRNSGITQADIFAIKSGKTPKWSPSKGGPQALARKVKTRFGDDAGKEVLRRYRIVNDMADAQ